MIRTLTKTVVNETIIGLLQAKTRKRYSFITTLLLPCYYPVTTLLLPCYKHVTTMFCITVMQEYNGEETLQAYYKHILYKTDTGM